MTPDLAALDRTIATLTERLLDRRLPSGHWEGHLASSALSTATATVALRLANRARVCDEGALIGAGHDWLIRNQNADGGWGDTTLSFSNLSTTLLCWSALSLATRLPTPFDHAIERAERWLGAQVGALNGASVRDAILERYGTDRTFSTPILTVLALAGKLGPEAEGWRLVPQLPFELAACPQRWFRWLRLPVVSYALPALVAIGRVRHHHAPTRNPLVRRIRSALQPRTLRVARQMQPHTGGYLEATPLTAFVVMSLIASGQTTDPIVTRGLRFLTASARADGSWPIDTNLATWVTTLSVEALTALDEQAHEDDGRILVWLLDQQLRQEHPFTHAKPGGWAWTDLAGGVPDADDTAGALLALWKLGGCTHVDAAVAGIDWLLDLQNADGGVPTFCRGWGALPFDRSAPDLTAHALEAWSVWYAAARPDLEHRISRAAGRAVAYLARHQHPDGSWTPLWFGNQHVPGEANLTYGTARVTAALAAPLVREIPSAARSRARALSWLLSVQNQDGGWGGGKGAPSSIEETGIALSALGANSEACGFPLRQAHGEQIKTVHEIGSSMADAMARGVRWLVTATDEGHRTPAAPIGVYFARLWYYEELYPLVFSLRGLSQARSVLISRFSAEAARG